MGDNELSRRRLMQLGLGAAATAGLASTSALAIPQPGAGGIPTLLSGALSSPLQTSLNNAYLFLDQMMDAYAQGNTIRMVQSYCDQIAGGTFYSTAFVYDNAMIALAYLARSKSGDLSRAKIIGDALLYAQANDPAADGRFRQAYLVCTSPQACRSSRGARSAMWPGPRLLWPSFTTGPA